jgi:hypothetical protein
MNCETARELLGRYHDGELVAAERMAVEAHLGACSTCPALLETIVELGDMTRSLSEAEPPGNLWDRLSLRLGKATPGRRSPAGRHLRILRLAAVAALVLIAFAAGWLTHQVFGPRGGAISHTGDDSGDKGLSVEDLLEARPGEPITLQDAASHVDFRVLRVADLPEGCRLQECSLCKGGCCNLVQCKCVCRGEQVLLVLTSPDQPLRYGNRPAVEMQVNGKSARVIQCDGCLACCWRAKGTTLALIGPRDGSDLIRLMADVDRRLETSP